MAFYVLLADSVTRTIDETLRSYPCPWKPAECCSSLTFYRLSIVTDKAFQAAALLLPRSCRTCLYRGVEECRLIRWQSTAKGKGSEIHCSLLLQLWDFSHFQPTEAKVAELKMDQDMRILDQL